MLLTVANQNYILYFVYLKATFCRTVVFLFQTEKGGEKKARKNYASNLSSSAVRTSNYMNHLFTTKGGKLMPSEKPTPLPALTRLRR